MNRKARRAVLHGVAFFVVLGVVAQTAWADALVVTEHPVAVERAVSTASPDDWANYARLAATEAREEARSWLQSAQINQSLCIVNGNTATGPPGVFSSAYSFTGRVRTALVGAGAPAAVADGWDAAFQEAWDTWADNVTIQGLPWYPTFLAYPGPAAPPTPNVPTPLSTAPSSGVSAMTTAALADRIRDNLGSAADEPDAQAAIDGFAEYVGANFPLMLGSALFSNVMGFGPVPINSPPFGPAAGPVVNGHCFGSGVILGYESIWPIDIEPFLPQAQAQAAGTKAELVSPAPGSTLAGDTATFAWDAGEGVSRYALIVGRSRGGDEILRKMVGQDMSAEVTGLPTDGSTVYLQLYSDVGGQWESNDYTFKASGAPSITRTVTRPVKAAIVDPAPGSTLSEDTAAFTWTEGQGVLRYALMVGTTPGGRDILRLPPGAQLSAKVAGLPTDGGTVYVRLFSNFESGWQFNDYRFQAAGAPTRTGTVTRPAKAELTSPAPGSTLPGEAVTFTWDEGQGVSAYVLLVGTGPGRSDFFRGVASRRLSVDVTTLPTDGSTVFVRLFSRFETGWEFNDYKFAAAGTTTTTGTVTSSAQAELVSPAPGSTLPGDSVTFAWSQGQGVSMYGLWVGKTQGDRDLASLATRRLSLAVTGLPTDGSAVYVRLTSSLATGPEFNDYVFTASGGATAPTPTAGSGGAVIGSGGTGEIDTDQYIRIYGFETEVSPGSSPDDAAAWQTLDGGTLSFQDAQDTLQGSDQFQSSTLGTATFTQATLTKRIGGISGKTRFALQASAFDTDLSQDVVAIHMVPLVFPAIEVSDPRSVQYKTFQPGQPQLGPITFTINENSARAGDISGWVTDMYDGQESRRTITVNLRLDPTESPMRTYNFFDCRPLSYAPLSFIDARTAGSVNQLTLTVSCNRVEFQGLAADVGQWMQDMLEKGDAASIYRNVDVTLLNREGADQRSHVFRDAFITQYTFPELDASSDQPAVEAIAFQPGYWETILP